MQLEILYQDSMLADTLPKVLKATTSIVQGNMPYSERALVALLTKLSTFLSRPAELGITPFGATTRDAPSVVEYSGEHYRTSQIPVNPAR